MATDKSLNIRQIKAAEETAAALAALKAQVEAMAAQLDRLEKALAELQPQPQPGKFETASRAATRK